MATACMCAQRDLNGALGPVLASIAVWLPLTARCGLLDDDARRLRARGGPARRRLVAGKLDGAFDRFAVNAAGVTRHAFAVRQCHGELITVQRRVLHAHRLASSGCSRIDNLE